MQRLIFKLHSPRYPLLMHYNLESRRLLIHEKLHRRIHFTTRAIRWKNNLKIYKKKKKSFPDRPWVIGFSTRTALLPSTLPKHPAPSSDDDLTIVVAMRPWHICNVVAVCRKTMPSSSSSSSHGHAAGLHQPPKITRAAPVKRAGQRPSIYRGNVPRIDHQLAPNYGPCTPSPLPVDRPKWNYGTPKVAPYVRRDRSKKKKKREKEVKMDGWTYDVPLLSSPFSSKLRNLRVILASRFLNIKHWNMWYSGILRGFESSSVVTCGFEPGAENRCSCR